MSDPRCELCGDVDTTAWGWARLCTCEDCGRKHMLCLYCCQEGDLYGGRPHQDVPQKICPDLRRVALALMGDL